MTAAETPVHLRDAVPGDGAAIHALVHALATYEREPDAVEATPEGYDQQLAAEVPPFACVLAELPGIGAVGFALTFRTYSTWKGRPGTWLEDFFVVPAARGRGIGEKLLREVARRALARGDGRLELAALDWNTLATDFYVARGFVAMNDWTTWRVSGEALTRLAE